MEKSVIFSGFGGQGALFAGQLLTYAALNAGRHVTWIPSYGPEMRGGTAHCTVVLGDEPIGSPLVRNPDMVVAMNAPSVDKYEPIIKSNGVFVVNSSLINRPLHRPDVHTIMIPANDIATRYGNLRLANVVLLGALLGASELLSLEVVEKALEEHLPKRHYQLLDANKAALREGAEFVRQMLPVS
jgi:2-oxoglutarate ferredoxin oxidoreductase subunit gamma